MGYVQQSREEMEVLFTLLSRNYSCNSRFQAAGASMIWSPSLAAFDLR
jgi:hypothetical protein